MSARAWQQIIGRASYLLLCYAIASALAGALGVLMGFWFHGASPDKLWLESWFIALPAFFMFSIPCLIPFMSRFATLDVEEAPFGAWLVLGSFATALDVLVIFTFGTTQTVLAIFLCAMWLLHSVALLLYRLGR